MIPPQISVFTTSDHHRALHQDRMLNDEADQVVVCPFRVVEIQFVIGRATTAQQGAGADAHAGEQGCKRGMVGRCGQVFDHLGLDPLLAQHRQHVARGAAFRVVVDGDVHGVQLPSTRTIVATPASAR
jgi:hypothetical protein